MLSKSGKSIKFMVDVERKGDEVSTTVSTSEDCSTEDTIMYLLFAMRSVAVEAGMDNKRLALMMAKSLKFLPNDTGKTVGTEVQA